MRNLVGRKFIIANGHYRIVDVRRTGADAMVYAERLEQQAPSAAAGPLQAPRTAFHYEDIAPLLEPCAAGRPNT